MESIGDPRVLTGAVRVLRVLAEEVNETGTFGAGVVDGGVADEGNRPGRELLVDEIDVAWSSWRSVGWVLGPVLRIETE